MVNNRRLDAGLILQSEDIAGYRPLARPDIAAQVSFIVGEGAVRPEADGKITAEPIPLIAVETGKGGLILGCLVTFFGILDLVAYDVNHQSILGGYAGIFGHIEGKLGAGAVTAQVKGVWVGGGPVSEDLASQKDLGAG